AAVGLAAAAAFLLPVTEVLIGRPKHALLHHLGQLTALVAGGWMLAAGAIALSVADWFRRWQLQNERVLLCAPLHSGLLRHVYYAAEPVRRTGATALLALLALLVAV